MPAISDILWAFELAWVFEPPFVHSKLHVPIFDAHSRISSERSHKLIVDVYDYESAIIFLCWTFKSAGHDLIDELFKLFLLKQRMSEGAEKKRFKLQTLALNLINWINFTWWWIFLHDIKKFIKLILFFLPQKSNQSCCGS